MRIWDGDFEDKLMLHDLKNTNAHQTSALGKM